MEHLQLHTLISYSSEDSDIETTRFHEFECNICTQIVNDPLLCKNCEATYCKQCIEQWLKKPGSEQRCPNCREIYEQHVSRRFNQRMSEVRLKCQFSKNGCTIKQAALAIRTHELTCEYRDKDPKAKVKCEDCSKEIEYGKLDKHKNKECEAKLIKCIHCNRKYHVNYVNRHENDTYCLKLQN